MSLMSMSSLSPVVRDFVLDHVGNVTIWTEDIRIKWISPAAVLASTLVDTPEEYEAYLKDIRDLTFDRVMELGFPDSGDRRRIRSQFEMARDKETPIGFGPHRMILRGRPESWFAGQIMYVPSPPIEGFISWVSDIGSVILPLERYVRKTNRRLDRVYNFLASGDLGAIGKETLGIQSELKRLFG